MQQPLLYLVRAHVLLEFALVALQRGGGRAVGQDVALDELLALGAVREALLQVVGGALALEFEGFGLEGAT